jgi:hypothetical protein
MVGRNTAGQDAQIRFYETHGTTPGCLETFATRINSADTPHPAIGARQRERTLHGITGHKESNGPKNQMIYFHLPRTARTKVAWPLSRWKIRPAKKSIAHASNGEVFALVVDDQ